MLTVLAYESTVKPGYRMRETIRSTVLAALVDGVWLTGAISALLTCCR